MQHDDPQKSTGQTASETAGFLSAADIERELEVHDYVMGRMDAQTQSAFEARIARDPSLARELEAERELAAGMAARASDIPDAAAFAQLQPNMAPKPRRFRAAQAVPVAATVLVALALILVLPWETPDPAFETLSVDDAATEANLVRIQFAGTLDARDRAALARRYGFEFVPGSETGGAWMVGMVRTTTPVDARLLDIWRADPLIVNASSVPAPH